MKCPRTGEELKPVVIDGIEIDVSMGCGGVWFDRFELNKFDEIHERAGEMLIEHMKEHYKPLDKPEVRLNCPVHTDAVMMRRYYSAKRQIEIDECPQCGGVWLDAEELDALRELFPSQEDHRKVQESFVEELMSGGEMSKQMDAMTADTQETLDKMNKVSNVLWSIVTLGMKK